MKEEFYKYAESLGIKINDAQRLMMLAKEEVKPMDKEAIKQLFDDSSMLVRDWNNNMQMLMNEGGSI